MSPLAKVVYAISNVLIHYIPILLGLFIFASACIGYGKPPVKWYVRFSVGVVGFLLPFLGIRLLIVSKWPTTRSTSSGSLLPAKSAGENSFVSRSLDRNDFALRRMD